jgi:uncharacterized membrane protein
MLTAMLVVAAATASSLPAAPPVDKAVEGALGFAGTEPFWGLEIWPGRNPLFSEPAEEDTKITELPPPIFQLSENGTVSFAAYGYEGSIGPGPCSDGMSDTVFPYTVTLELLVPPGRSLKGCGYRPWGQDVAAAMPVIDSCFAEGKFLNAPPETIPPVVFYAAASGPQDGYVLLSGPSEDVRYRECAVTSGKAVLKDYQGDAPPPGTEREIFVRKTGIAGEMQPGGQCYDAEEVKSEAGEVLGWWMDPLGC